MTRFQEGQRVQALSSSQGLLEGEEYTVASVEEMHTMFGNFAGYYLQRTPSEHAIRVLNGHLLLREVR